MNKLFLIYYPISALINAVTSSIVCIFVLVKNPKSKLNRTFSLFAFSVAFWSYSYYFWQESDNNTSAIFWCKVLMAGAIFIPSTLFHFSITFFPNFFFHFSKSDGASISIRFSAVSSSRKIG